MNDLVTFINSFIAIIPTTEVSFKRKIELAAIKGIEIEIAWGKITYLKSCILFIPKLKPDSIWFFGTASIPALRASLM